MILKASIICLVLVLYMGILYFKNRHLPLKSSGIFIDFYISVIVFCIFDIITLYTVNHLDTVNSTINLVAHLVYLISINVIMYLLLLYLRSYLEQELRISRTIRILHCVPIVVSTILILILPLDYIVGKETNYSMGEKVYALYVSVAIYNILILYYSLRYWKRLNTEKRKAIVAAVPIFISTSLLNVIFPEALLTCLGVTMIILGLMLSTENMEKYIDKQTSMFNQYAFETVLSEEIRQNKMFYISVIGLGESDDALENINLAEYIRMLNSIYRYAEKERNIASYRICENGCAFLTPSLREAESMIDGSIQYLEREYGAEHFRERHIIIPYREGKSESEMIASLVTFCMEQVNKMAYLDFLTGARNQNSLKKEMERLDISEGTVYYMIADLNGLKRTNDTMGHSAGDELLQSFARLLMSAVGTDGMVFRRGGDEFSILWRGKDIQTFLQKLEQKRIEVNRYRAIPISFAIGYGLLKEGYGIKEADDMMYENKKKMKRKDD